MAAACPKLALLIVLVAAQGSLSCRYFCRDPVKHVYHCCDDGNPYTTVQPVVEEGNEGTQTTNEDGGLAVTTLTPNGTLVEYGPEDGAKYSEPSGCRYYCAYRNSVYCCDDGSLTMPGDHDPNTGRCPSLAEQVCKGDAIFLALKAKKVGKTKTGSEVLSKIGDDEVLCASDGYCSEDERCCPSVCHKRHACLKTLHTDKTKQ